ncbi:MAG: cytochrome c [Planctomycetota bacterium]
MSRRVPLAAVALALLLIGCDAPVDRYPPNDVYALTLARSFRVPTDLANTDTTKVVTELFGTPEQPQWPVDWLPEDAGNLVDLNRIERAAGAVSSEKDGTHRGLFREHCVTCHGVAGDGAGPASQTQNPYPRDFRHGVFKWKSTERADKPTREDLRETLVHGVPGTGMPSFSLLVKDDLESLIDYTIYLSVRGEVERRLMVAAIDELGYEDTLADPSASLTLRSDTDGEEIVRSVLARVTGQWVGAQAVTVSKAWEELSGEELTASIARGKEIFHSQVANCVGCHGPGGNGQAITLDYDDWAKEYSTRLGITPDDREAMRPFRRAGALRPRPVRPRNLQNAVFRGGSDTDDLYRRITQGIAGTPMPALAVVDGSEGNGLTEAEIWDLVRYLRSFGSP